MSKPERLYLDIETRSRVDLRKSSVYRYVECPDFEILMCAWALDDDPVQIAVGRKEIEEIPYLLDPDVTHWAHNAQFERVCFSAFRGMPVGEYLPPEPWDDTAALAAEWGYPRKLEHLAVALGGEEKDSAGTRLIHMFSIPNRRGEFTAPEEKPEHWQSFKDYCVQDVAVLRDIHQNLPGWPTPAERSLYLEDQRINDAGIAVDVEMATAAVSAADDNRMEQEMEISEITGVSNPGSNQQMMSWLHESGLPLENLQAKTVTDTLDRDDLTDEQRRVLELRKELALVASKKYTAAIDRTNSDGRLRGTFQFFGAHTGRWAGRGVQLQNLPSASLESEDAAEDAILDLKLGFGADAHTLKALVRQMFTGPFTVVDYSAIEARVIAWLAGEDWALDAFRAGRDIYVETAERMGGLTRKEGKVATLALGYQGGVGSLKAMGAEGDRDYLQFLVNQWRTANQSITELWAEMDAAFRSGDRPVGDHLFIERDEGERRMRLPSGRYLCYRGLKSRMKTTPWGATMKQVSFADPKKPGLRTDTYGGRLTENATQAVARDVLSEALVRLADRGYGVVAHVHDEVIVEDSEDVQGVSEVMTQETSWSSGLPVSAEGYTTLRYRKD